MFWNKYFWLLKNPGLNPLDYFKWSVIKRNSKVASLKAASDVSYAGIKKIYIVDNEYAFAFILCDRAKLIADLDSTTLKNMSNLKVIKKDVYKPV